MTTTRFLPTAACLGLIFAAAPAFGQLLVSDTSLKFEPYRTADGRVVWRVRSAGVSEPVAARAIDFPAVAEPARPADPGFAYEIYQDSPREYRWRLRAANGQVIAVSWQAYPQKADAERAINTIRAVGPTAKVNDQSR